MCCRARGGCTKSEKICDYIIVALSETKSWSLSSCAPRDLAKTQKFVYTVKNVRRMLIQVTF